MELYLEAATEMEESTFFGEDDRCTLESVLSSQGSKVIGAQFGTAEVLSRALIAFRKLWMKKEPSHFERVGNLFVAFAVNEERVAFAAQQMVLFRHNLTGPAFRGQSITKESFIDLWINARFAHGGKIDERLLLKKLEKELTPELVEYTFRQAVKSAGYHYLAVARDCILPELTEWKEQLGITLPSQQDGLKNENRGSGIKRTSGGSLLPCETREQRFSRVLDRDRFRTLKRQLLHAFNFDSSADEERRLVALRETSRAVIKHDSFSDLLRGRGITIVSRASHLQNRTSYSKFLDSEAARYGRIRYGRIQWQEGQAVWMTKAASAFLERNYSEFRQTLVREETQRRK
jgi:hypothetical protein